MNRITGILRVFFIIMIFQSLVSAQGISLPLQQPDTPQPKDFSIGFTYGYGAAYPTGSIEGDGGQKSIPGKAESFSIEAGYMLFSNKWLLMSLGARESEIISEAEYAGNIQRNYIEERFFDISLAGRYVYHWFYCDIDLYYGLPYGSWYKKASLDSKITETSVRESRKNYEIGAGLGLGFLMPVSESFFFQAGLSLSVPFTASYREDGTKLRNNTLELICGMQYRI